MRLLCFRTGYRGHQEQSEVLLMMTDCLREENNVFKDNGKILSNENKKCLGGTRTIHLYAQLNEIIRGVRDAERGSGERNQVVGSQMREPTYTHKTPLSDLTFVRDTQLHNDTINALFHDHPPQCIAKCVALVKDLICRSRKVLLRALHLLRRQKQDMDLSVYAFKS